MRIAFCHNLALDDSETFAEFDSPQTVTAITEALVRLGHDVFPVDVAMPLEELCDTLSRLAPELIFNTAEGFGGPEREALYPAMYAALGLPFTGSDARGCLITLDKHLTRLLVAARGVPVSPGGLIPGSSADLPAGLRFPVFVKPNFEGSSKGIDAAGLAFSEESARVRAKALLDRFPDGVLVEEYVEGIDVVVPWIEALGPLPACSYHFGRDVPASGATPLDPSGPAIYDYDLKHSAADDVSVVCPAAIARSVADRLAHLTREVVDALALRDLARLDFRVTPTGDVFFLEVNALPSLEPGASIYAAAQLVGLSEMDDVLAAVIETAVARAEIIPTLEPEGRAVGLAYNLARVKADPNGDRDHEAEFDAPETVAAIAGALRSLGHAVVHLEAKPGMLDVVRRRRVDVVFNIAEGYAGRAREAQVPALLELLGVPYTGSDPTALAVTLDKALAKRIVASAGVPTAAFCVLSTGIEPLPPEFRFPAVVKPLAEGSSKGLHGASVVADEEAMREAAWALIHRYRQPALAEVFLSGREFTVGVLEWPTRRALPVMEIVFDGADQHPVYSFSHKQGVAKGVGYQVPASLEPELAATLESAALTSFEALGCRDVARMDFRMDRAGQVCFIECNPLPGLTPGWSDLCLIGDAAGISYESLIDHILQPALLRLTTERP